MSEIFHARLFQNGGSQAVRLPRECRFEGTEVVVRKEGDRVILEPVQRAWSREFLAEFSRPPAGGFPERAQPAESDRRPDIDG